MAGNQHKILIVAPSWVGDMVMSQTLFKELKAKYGAGVILDVLVNDWAANIVKRMPEVNAVHHNPFAHGKLALVQRIYLGFKLRHYAYDEAYVLPNSFKSAIIPFFACIKTRIGFIGEKRFGILNKHYKLDKEVLPRMVDRFLALANDGAKALAISYPQLVVNHANQERLLVQLHLNLNKPVICICPGAEYGPAKRWPTTHFAALADLLQISGYQVWIMGSVKDAIFSTQIMAYAKLTANLHDLCGKTALVDVVDLLALAQVVVSNDSGLMHIACAVNVAVLVIYGSTSPQFTPPLSDKAKIYQLDLECSPCFDRTCRFGHYNCLQQITPTTIFKQIANSL